MNDYISRHEAIATAFAASGLGNSKYRDVCDIAERLRKIPAADVAEVVKCKDCKNADSNGMGCCCVWCNEMQQVVSEDGWCYRGEDMRGEA